MNEIEERLTEVSGGTKDPSLLGEIENSHIQILEARKSDNERMPNKSTYSPPVSPIRSDTSFIQPFSNTNNGEKSPLFEDVIWKVNSTHKIDLPESKKCIN